MVFWFDSVIGDCSVGTTGVVGLSGWSGGGLSTYFRQGISCQFVCSWTRSHSPSSCFNTSSLPLRMNHHLLLLVEPFGRNLYFLLTSTCLPTVVSFPIVEDTTDAVAAREQSVHAHSMDWIARASRFSLEKYCVYVRCYINIFMTQNCHLMDGSTH